MPRSATAMSRTAENTNVEVRRGKGQGLSIRNLVVITLLGTIVIALLITMAVLSRLNRPIAFRKLHHAANMEANTVARALSLYLLDEGFSLPPDDFDLNSLLLSTEQGGGSNGPYLASERDLNDPWGNRYQLRMPAIVNINFDIVSYGADGQPGGVGPAADITQ